MAAERINVPVGDQVTEQADSFAVVSVSPANMVASTRTRVVRSLPKTNMPDAFELTPTKPVPDDDIEDGDAEGNFQAEVEAE